jgi:hypothetical protein
MEFEQNRPQNEEPDKNGYESFDGFKSRKAFEYIKNKPEIKAKIKEIKQIREKGKVEQEKFDKEIDELLEIPEETRKKAKQEIEERENKREKALAIGLDLLEKCREKHEEIYLSDLSDENKKEFDEKWLALKVLVREENLGTVLADEDLVEGNIEKLEEIRTKLREGFKIIDDSYDYETKKGKSLQTDKWDIYQKIEEAHEKPETQELWTAIFSIKKMTKEYEEIFEKYKKYAVKDDIEEVQKLKQKAKELKEELKAGRSPGVEFVEGERQMRKVILTTDPKKIEDFASFADVGFLELINTEKLSTEKRTYVLGNFSPVLLGLSRNCAFPDFLQEAKNKGLKLCPPELLLYLSGFLGETGWSTNFVIDPLEENGKPITYRINRKEYGKRISKLEESDIGHAIDSPGFTFIEEEI